MLRVVGLRQKREKFLRFGVNGLNQFEKLLIVDELVGRSYQQQQEEFSQRSEQGVFLVPQLLKIGKE